MAYDDNEDWLRFVLTLPVLRLFAAIKRTRNLVFTLIQLIPGQDLFAIVRAVLLWTGLICNPCYPMSTDFISVVSLMLVVFFLYGVVGVFFFGGEWDILQGNNVIMSTNVAFLMQPLMFGFIWSTSSVV